VVMLADGTVIDPLDPQPTRLDAYMQVDNIAAIVPFESQGKDAG
jgi:hypothetical protein